MTVPEIRSIIQVNWLKAYSYSSTVAKPILDSRTLLPDYDPRHPEHQEWWTTSSGNYIFGEQFLFRLLPAGGVQRRLGATGQPVTNKEDKWSQTANQFELDVRLERTIIMCFGTVGSEQEGIKGFCIDVQTNNRTPWQVKKV